MTNPLEQLALDIKHWARELGFQQAGITDCDLSFHEAKLQEWLDEGLHGDMGWMAEHGNKRSRPGELHENTVRVISVRMDYLPGDTRQVATLKDEEKAYVSRYALGRDYHKLIRKRLAQLGKQVEKRIAELIEQGLVSADQIPNQRPFVDSAPVLERALGEKSGLGWIGKNTMLIHPQAGSWFFLGEIYTNIPLPVDDNTIEDKCGECTACLKVCPTDAFIGSHKLDARRCISYLTIENKGAIPEEFRQPIGNRIYGCDDCQIICPWNKYAQSSEELDFFPRHKLDSPSLLHLFGWTEAQFLKNTEGSPIRRIGHEAWQRNLAVALGNAPQSLEILETLKQHLEVVSPMVAEHIEWAIERQEKGARRKRKVKRKNT